jgi:hypothetical protein
MKELRFFQGCTAAASLMQQGYVVFSPIAHSHAVETNGMDKLETGDFWLDQDLVVLSKCDKVIVLMLPGWEYSRGVKREVEFAKKNNIEVEYLTYESLIGANREAEVT